MEIVLYNRGHEGIINFYYGITTDKNTIGFIDENLLYLGSSEINAYNVSNSYQLSLSYE